MNEEYDVPLISSKLSSFFLAYSVYHLEETVVNTRCAIFLAENKHGSHLIHILLIWCKITKFILFSRKKAWKSAEKHE